MAKEAKRDLDLTQSDTDHSDSPNPPAGRTGDKIKAGVEIELGIILPVFCVLLVAVVAHKYLAMSGATSMMSGIAVVVGVSYPKYSAAMLKHLSNLASKIKNKQ
jgi:hypothetical protein